MGQQQLLLLILAIIVLGVATMLGIDLFVQNSAEANQQALTRDVLTIAGRALAWYKRPAELGGGGRSYASITIAKMNFPAANANGSFSISGSGNTATITGTGVEDAGGAVGPLQIQVSVGVDTVGTAIVTP